MERPGVQLTPGLSIKSQLCAVKQERSAGAWLAVPLSDMH
jgi:hypothetical protein